MSKNEQLQLLSHIRPIHLLTTIGVYLTGTGLARYLGERIDLSIFVLGLIWLILMQGGFYFLGDHYQTPFEIGLLNRTPFNSPRRKAEVSSSDDLKLYISLSLFCAAGVLTALLAFRGLLTIPAGIVMLFFFGGFFFLAVPGISLDSSGIGEIICSMTLVLIPPALGFLLQFDEFHPFLVFGIFPLFPLHFALIILLRLVSFRDDLRLGRKNLLVRIGWIQAIYLHNLMVFCGFLLFGVAMLFGFPTRINGFTFFALPAALYLVWYLSKLENGAPVRWQMIALLSLIVFFLPLYLITFSTWVN
jgi:1,4-dihydroxy-2-naphthoate octaprenyltransferase